MTLFFIGMLVDLSENSSDRSRNRVIVLDREVSDHLTIGERCENVGQTFLGRCKVVEIQLNFHRHGGTNVPFSHVKEQVLVMEDRDVLASDVVTRPRTLHALVTILSDYRIAVAKISHGFHTFPLVVGRVDVGHESCTYAVVNQLSVMIIVRNLRDFPEIRYQLDLFHKTKDTQFTSDESKCLIGNRFDDVNHRFPHYISEC